MSYGDLYGQEYGSIESGVDFVCALAKNRIFDWHPVGGDLDDLICGLVEIYGDALEVVEELQDSFDLEDAVGAQLDIVGGWMGLPRSGQLDERYRDLLKIQQELILSADSESERWVGTGESILTITRRFLGPEADPIGLRFTKPKDYILSVPGNLLVNEVETLSFFLTQATWSEVLGHVLFPLVATFFAWDSATAGPAITGEMTWDSATAGAPITGAGTWGTDILIGLEEI